MKINDPQDHADIGDRQMDPQVKGRIHSNCLHCGNPIPAGANSDFCCSGCQYVYHLIRDKGLEHYYELKDRTIPPVGTTIFENSNYEWLQKLKDEAESKAGVPQLVLSIHGLSCVGCLWLLEKVFNDMPGALSIGINSQTARVRLTWERNRFDLIAFAGEIQRLGYRLTPPDRNAEPESSTLGFKLGLCAAFAMNAMIFTLPDYLGMEESFSLAPLFELLALMFATFSMAVGGSYFIARALKALKRGVIHMDFPIAIGVTAAYVGSLIAWLLREKSFLYFDFVSVFMFLMILGRWVQERAVERNRSRLDRNAMRTSDIVVSETGDIPGKKGNLRRIPLDELKENMVFQVQPGTLVPVSSKLLHSNAAFSLEWINGESDPIQRRHLQNVPSGARLLSTEPVWLKSETGWPDSMLYRLLHAESESPPLPRNFEVILRTYLATVLILAAIGGLGWAVSSGNWIRGLQVAISLLVVSCPCSLGVALPLANEMAVARLRRKSLFVKEHSLWPRLRKINYIVFDKTGTLTFETPELLDTDKLHELPAEAREALYYLVQDNPHPVARSLKQELLGRFPDLDKLADSSPPVTETVGIGVSLQMKGETWSLSRPQKNTPTSGSNGDSVLSRNGRPCATFRFKDAVRRDAADEMQMLQSMGLRVAILSGDRPEKVKAIQEQLRLQEITALGGLTPEEKERWIRENAGPTAMMIGDGANDSLAFDAALCRGTPVVDKGLLEGKADFYFLSRGLQPIRDLLLTARLRYRLLYGCFVFAVSYNIFAATLCLLGLMNPLLAAILMPLSSLVTVGVVSWGLRF